MSTGDLTQRNVGDTHPTLGKIALIYGQSTKVLVFRDEPGQVRWETSADTLTQAQSAAHQAYDRLHARVLSCIPAGKKRTALIDEMALALFLGLSEADETKAARYFDDVAARVTHEAQVEARLTYLAAGSIAAGAIVGVALAVGYFTSTDARAVVAGAAAGAVGAWASILSRVAQLELGRLETPANLKFQGITRILLGMIFGIVAIVAMKSGQVFPAVSTNAWFTTLVTFIGGWSERLVPEIMSKVEARVVQAAASGPGTGKP